MRFLISEFEHLFTESNLRKGLRLVQKKKPVLVEKHGHHYGYEVGDFRVSLQKTSLEIDHCHCECTALFCEHVAALMFSFLDPSFDRLENRRLKRQKACSRAGAAFLNAFAVFQKQWKELQLQGADTPSGLNRFSGFIENNTKRSNFATDLAAMAALSLPGRMALSVEAVGRLNSTFILRHFTGSIHKTNEEVMYLSLLEMCRTNERLASGQFSSVLPVYLTLTANMFHLEELRVTFEKRQYRKFYSELFDELQVAKMMVFFRRCTLEGKEIKLVKTSPPENFIALVRLHFAAQQLKEAWSVLEKLKQLMHETLPLSYFGFLNYLINVSTAVNDRTRELRFTEELVLNSPYLSADLAAKYLGLLPANQRRNKVKNLMAVIRNSRSEGAADKIFILAMASGYTEDFLQFATRHKVKFHMLHDLLLKHGDPGDEEEAQLYFKSLQQSLLQTEFVQSRFQMIEFAAQFLPKLPANLAAKMFLDVHEFISLRPALRVHEKAWLKLQPQGRTRKYA